MSLGALLSLLMAIAKAFPAAAKLADQFGAAWREHRRTQAHAGIRDAVVRAQELPWECPPTCPHREQLGGMTKDQ